ncbi:MFS transporter [uncultured Jatrophihabitans sp.]|uniref:MFS transporter n=1 Tax=uncultured Jatrophihabitans sp. TaxID=1610747 RepID=UPI0035CCA051
MDSSTNSQNPAHSAPGIAVGNGLEPGKHTPSDTSIAVADLIDGHAHEPSADPGRGGNESESGNGNGNKWVTLVAVCLGTFMLLLDVTIVNVALPDIQTALKSSFSDLQWVVDAYALTLAALLLTAGSLADMFGRRLLYVIGLTIFTIASFLCGIASDTLLLQLSRGLQGVGGAIMFSVSLALLANAFRGKDRGVAFGVWGAITGLAVAIGPLLGGAQTSGLSWRWIFFVNLPIGVAAVVLTLVKVGESKLEHSPRPDWLGFVLFSVGLAALVYGLIESNQKSFSDPTVIGALVAAGVLLVAFVVVEALLKQPMFDLSLFRKPTFTGGAVAAFGLSASIFALLLYLTLYIQDVLGYNAFQTGLRLLVLSGGILVTSTIAGRLTERVPIRFLIGPGLLMVGIGLLLMRGLDASTEWTHLVPGLLLAGFGVGMVNPPLASTAIGVVTPQRAGMASGINSTFRQVGIATGIAVLGTLFSSKVKDDVMALVSGVPGLQGKGAQLAAAVQAGQVGRVAGRLPANQRAKVQEISTSSFADGLNHILLVAAILVLAAGVIALLTIRTKDLVARGGD